MTNQTIRLESSNEWISWLKALKVKSKNEDLWVYIDPTVTNKPTLKVVAPTPPDISAVGRRSATAARAATTLEASSSSTQETATQEVEPQVEEPGGIHTDYEIQTRQIPHLTEKDHRTVATMRATYDTYLKNYKDLKRRTSAIQDWVLDTVDEGIARHHFSENDTLAEWVQSLYDEFSLTQTERKQEARRAYREVLAKPQRRRYTTYKGTSDWLKQWRISINEARDVGLQEAEEADQWFTDLITALRSTPLESWANAYSVTQMNHTRTNTLSIGVVAADIRLALASQPDTQRAKVSHGAFLAGSKEEDEEENESPRRPRPKGHKGKKRPRQGSGEGKAGRCEACGMRHTLSKCFYAFPEKAYAGFKPVQAIANQAQRRIEENKEGVADRIKKLKLESSA
ncbi:hypothetical protein IL306_004019 [Fusarium sp. DS 682]|nr:hypothetical protein IL306_004019 [Fusarium sp. DS 682]